MELADANYIFQLTYAIRAKWCKYIKYILTQWSIHANVTLMIYSSNIHAIIYSIWSLIKYLFMVINTSCVKLIMCKLNCVPILIG